MARIPQVIINKIVAEVGRDVSKEKDPALRSQGLGPLFACSLTSRGFNLPSRELIFSRVAIWPRSEDRPWEDDEQFLSNHAYILRLIKSFVLYYDPSRFDTQKYSPGKAFNKSLHHPHLRSIFKMLSDACNLEEFELNLCRARARYLVLWTTFGNAERASIEELLIGQQSQQMNPVRARTLKLREIQDFPSHIITSMQTLERLFLDQVTFVESNHTSPVRLPSLRTLVFIDSPEAARMIYDRALVPLSHVRELRMTLRNMPDLRLAFSILTSMSMSVESISLFFQYFSNPEEAVALYMIQNPLMPRLKTLIIECQNDQIHRHAYYVLFHLRQCDGLEDLRLLSYGDQFPDIQSMGFVAANFQWNVFHELLNNPSLFPSMRSITLELAVPTGETPRNPEVDISLIRDMLATRRSIRLNSTVLYV